MRVLTQHEIQSVSGAISLFYPTLLVGQIFVSVASTYATVTNIKTNFMTYAGAQTIVNIITFPVFNVPMGCIAMIGAGALAGYYAYHIIEAI